MKRRVWVVLAGVALFGVAGCNDTDDPAPPTSSAPVTTTTSSMTSTPTTPAGPTASLGSFTVAPSDVTDSLTLDLEGTPCNGVNDVTFDGTTYRCVDGVFRAQ